MHPERHATLLETASKGDQSTQQPAHSCTTRVWHTACTDDDVQMSPVPSVPFNRPATYEDLAKLPDNLVAEIVNGELHASPSPAPPHTRASATRGPRLDRPYRLTERRPGRLADPRRTRTTPRARHRRSRLRRLAPDTNAEAAGPAYFTLAPDWICEILSPYTLPNRPHPKARHLAPRAGVSHLAHRPDRTHARSAAPRRRPMDDSRHALRVGRRPRGAVRRRRSGR